MIIIEKTVNKNSMIDIQPTYTILSYIMELNNQSKII